MEVTVIGNTVLEVTSRPSGHVLLLRKKTVSLYSLRRADTRVVTVRRCRL